MAKFLFGRLTHHFKLGEPSGAFLMEQLGKLVEQYYGSKDAVGGKLSFSAPQKD